MSEHRIATKNEVLAGLKAKVAGLQNYITNHMKAYISDKEIKRLTNRIAGVRADINELKD